jgi:hypothetical protein
MRAASTTTTEPWISDWLDAVAAGSSTMSQRSLSSIEKHGGLGAVTVAAVERKVHLLLVEDEDGREIIAASKKPLKVIC